MDIQLKIGQYGFIPLTCSISARAVSGLIECKELAKAENRLANFIVETGEATNRYLGKSTFKGTLTLLGDRGNTLRNEQTSPESTQDTSKTKSMSPSRGAKILSSTYFLEPGAVTHHSGDAIGATLAKTFLSKNLNDALDCVVTGIDVKRTFLDKPVLRGIGSGSSFDPGVEWITGLAIKQKEKRKVADDVMKTTGLLPPPQPDRIIEGLRVPPNLDVVPGVNFVLTQEVGKLKPKDLKIAIERNRQDREKRAEEQRKMREEGGGAGVLDLSGILAEERLNSLESDPFKRQLREMACLSDIDDVQKQEIEKGFRVSEEYIGANILSSLDVEIIIKQRKQGIKIFNFDFDLDPPLSRS